MNGFEVQPLRWQLQSCSASRHALQFGRAVHGSGLRAER